MNSVLPEMDVFNLPVFADANIWAMWPADKLNELAEDIKDNGFDHRYPLTVAQVSGEWMLLDGRNRREAAKMAGVIPPVIVTDIDPKLAVHRSNNQNRDATPGQKAMATAMAFPEVQRGGDRKTSAFKSLQNDLNQSERNAISRARYVLRNNPIPEGADYPQRIQQQILLDNHIKQIRGFLRHHDGIVVPIIRTMEERGLRTAGEALQILQRN